MPFCVGFYPLCSLMKGLRAPRGSSIATGFLWMLFPGVVVKCSKQSPAPGDRTKSLCFCWTRETLRRCCAWVENQSEAGAREEARVAFEDWHLVLLENHPFSYSGILKRPWSTHRRSLNGRSRRNQSVWNRGWWITRFWRLGWGMWQRWFGSLRSSSKPSLNPVTPCPFLQPPQNGPCPPFQQVILGRDIQRGASLERRWQKAASPTSCDFGAVWVAPAGSHSAKHFSCSLVFNITMQGRKKVYGELSNREGWDYKACLNIFWVWQMNIDAVLQLDSGQYVLLFYILWTKFSSVWWNLQ